MYIQVERRTITCLAILFLSLICRRALAEDATKAPPPPPPVWDFDFYGSLRANIAATDGTASVDNNASRIGIDTGLTMWNVRPFAHLELGVNLVSSNTSYNADGNNAGDDFLKFTASSGPAPITTRLGFLGIEMGKFGTLTLGKQWGVYYDIAGWTDEFRVFGGEGNTTYTSGTDGGITGTGRADKSVQYRVGFKGLRAAIQGQLTGDADHVLKSWGASLSYNFDFGLSFGAAYNTMLLDNGITKTNLVGYDGSAPRGVIGGISFKHEGLQLAVTGSGSWNMQIVQPGESAVMYDSWGLEILARYILKHRFGPVLGWNLNRPIDPASSIDKRFEVNYLVVGLEFRFVSKIMLYTEEKLDFGHGPSGEPPSHVYTVGLRFGFSTEEIFGAENK